MQSTDNFSIVKLAARLFRVTSLSPMCSQEIDRVPGKQPADRYAFLLAIVRGE
jgi:hypothetical protein